jgi:hypothetical protein
MWRPETETAPELPISRPGVLYCSQVGGVPAVRAIGPRSCDAPGHGSCEAMINPSGVWHTAHVHEPVRFMTITPGQGTEHLPR